MIHTFERGGMKLALDCGSGSVHLLDDIAFELLSVLSEAEIVSGTICTDITSLDAVYGNNNVIETFYELHKMAKDGVMFSSDDYSEFLPRLGEAPVKAMCLHVAHDCNLRCEYCFAETGDFGGQRKLMPANIAKKAIDMLVKLSEGRHNIEVDFFGGEPLMNMNVVKETVDYARSIEEAADKNFRFTITTNGLALNDETTDYINKEMVNVVLSLDGRKSVNDKMRKTTANTSSYDIIVPKYQKLVNQRGDKEYYVRGTYTRDNLDFDKDIIHLYNLGFDQISVEPVVGPEEDDYSIQEQHLQDIEQSYERLLSEMHSRHKNQENMFNFFHFMIDLDNGPCAIKRLKGCGSGNEYIAVTPEGDIYPCHQFVGNNDFIMGNVDEGITRSDLKEKFANAHVLNKPECTKCWAKLFCSGGCNANNYNYCGALENPHKISCELEKIRLECAIALKVSQILDS